MERLVVVKSGGDIATGIAHRLFRSGFKVVLTETDQPTVIRRAVAFAEAVYSGHMVVEGVTARRTEVSGIVEELGRGNMPIIVDPKAACIGKLKPWAVVDAILAKKNTGTCIDNARIVVGVGPGFIVGEDVHAVVETMRGHNLGRVIRSGSAYPNTGIPGDIGGYTNARVLRAPVAGIFQGMRGIGDVIKAGDVVGRVGEVVVRGTIDGVLRGILYNGLKVEAGMKIGDIDPRCQREHCFSISDKARAVGGGVLEALLWLGAIL